MSRTNGLLPISANFEPQVAGPFDARMICDTKADLLLATTWEANDGGHYAYVGMLVTVYGDTTPANNGVYRLAALPYTSAGNWEQLGTGSGSWSPISQVTLGDTFATNQAFKLVSGLAQPIYSTGSPVPYVDGVVLESGIASAVVSAAMVGGNLYATPLTLPAGSPLYLGQDGKPTATQPSLIAGDVWYVSTMRRDDSTHFIFSPSQPIKL